MNGSDVSWRPRPLRVGLDPRGSIVKQVERFHRYAVGDKTGRFTNPEWNPKAMQHIAQDIYVIAKFFIGPRKWNHMVGNHRSNGSAADLENACMPRGTRPCKDVKS